jgi:cytochrome c peroxidase
MRSLFQGIFSWGIIGFSAVGVGCGGVPMSSDGSDEAVGAQQETLSGSATLTANQFGNPGTIEIIATNATGGLVGVDHQNPFFQNLGTNGRTCNSCHKVEAAMGISVAQIQSIFNATQGLDPIFRINDGSNAPTGPYANTSTLSARQASFSMLLNHGDIRVGIPMPAGADFSLASVQDPYFFASAKELSLFRRPMPSVNMAFSTQVMWDGRESEAGRTDVRNGLINQANDATLGHAQAATALTTAQRTAIADFQLRLFAAQSHAHTSFVRSNGTTTGVLDTDLNVAGNPPTTTEVVTGNPENLLLALVQASSAGGNGTFNAIGAGSPARLVPGTNNPFATANSLLPRCPDDGANHTGCFKNQALTAFEPWESGELQPITTDLVELRGRIGDGENTFYNRPFNMTDVPGLTDVLGKTTVSVTCTTCHNTPQAGTNSSARMFNTKVAEAAGNNPVFTSDFPIYAFRRNSDQNQIVYTDPGLGLRTGKFSDIGKFKVPSLRGLGSRAPYFHNGSAKTLKDVVNFYNVRFGIGLTADEQKNLVLFLQQT